MVASADNFYILPKDYLEGERVSPVKHEYRQGEVWAMAGGSDAHVTITGNIHAVLRNHLRGSGCRLYMVDMRVRVQRENCYYYPDVVVTCDDRDRNPEDFKQFPKLIIEVLSPSTEAVDRGKKFADYRSIETLQEYVLVSQTESQVECYRRNSNGKWELESYGKSDRVHLESVNLQLSMADIYEDVLFS